MERGKRKEQTKNTTDPEDTRTTEGRRQKDTTARVCLLPAFDNRLLVAAAGSGVGCLRSGRIEILLVVAVIAAGAFCSGPLLALCSFGKKPTEPKKRH